MAAGTDLAGCAALVVVKTIDQWPHLVDILTGDQAPQDAIDRSIRARCKTLLRLR